MTNKLHVSRTLGFEIEGLVDLEEYEIDDMEVTMSEVGYDSSISGDGEPVEVRTEPINDINILERVYANLGDYGFFVNDTCGLHIHVDINDFTVEDKAKLLRFGAGIELLMYSLVCPTRYYGRDYLVGRHDSRNNFCESIHHSWRKLFRRSFISQEIPFDDFNNLDELCSYVSENGNTSRCWNGKYQWLNANVGRFPTVEFRIFSATNDYTKAQKFGMIAYHIVETVKNSTIEQLQFIIKSIYQSSTLDEMFEKFFDAIGLDNEFRLPIENDTLAEYIYNKYCVSNHEQAV